QLPGNQRQVTRRQALAEPEATGSRGVFAGPGGLHLQRRELPVAQQLAHLACTVGFEHTLLLTPPGVQRHVFESGHYSSRVTRSTSSRVVVPSSTLRRPSSRMLGPSVRACRVMSCSAVWLWIMV